MKNFIKKAKIPLFISLICVGTLFFALSFNSNERKYTVEQMLYESDYVILASNSPHDSDADKTTNLLFSPKPSKTFQKDGKYYKEMEIVCLHQNFISEKITVISNKKYFSDKNFEMYILFISKAKEGENHYTITNEKAGIIRLKNGKFQPLDKDLKEDWNALFNDMDSVLDWVYTRCKFEKTEQNESTSEAISTTSPSTTQPA